LFFRHFMDSSMRFLCHVNLDIIFDSNIILFYSLFFSRAALAYYFKQSINQSINQSTNKSINPSSNPPSHQ